MKNYINYLQHHFNMLLALPPNEFNKIMKPSPFIMEYMKSEYNLSDEPTETYCQMTPRTYMKLVNSLNNDMKI